jgi:hypothetical protein
MRLFQEERKEKNATKDIMEKKVTIKEKVKNSIIFDYSFDWCGSLPKEFGTKPNLFHRPRCLPPSGVYFFINERFVDSIKPKTDCHIPNIH